MATILKNKMATILKNKMVDKQFVATDVIFIFLDLKNMGIGTKTSNKIIFNEEIRHYYASWGSHFEKWPPKPQLAKFSWAPILN